MRDRQDIIFFDAHCGLCWRAMQWIIARDQKSSPRFFFSSYRGRTARKYNLGMNQDDETLCVVTARGEKERGAKAVLYILTKVDSFPWRFLGILLSLLYPCLSLLYEAIYRAIARKRKSIFSCSLPTDKERDRVQRRLLP